MTTRTTWIIAGTLLTAALTLAAPSPAVQAQAAAAAAGLSPGSYGWPLRPFHAQHPVRGFFGDPRIANHETSRQFHFGVDVSGRNGTRVYATLTGTVRIHPLHPDVVLIDGPPGVEFSYWHIVPSVRTGQRAVAYRTVIGRIEAPWAHVHFSEMRSGRYLNPLRPGAMGPYFDPTTPVVRRVRVEQRGRSVRLSRARGSVDLVVEAVDRTPLTVPRPWQGLRVLPALIRWRLTSGRGPATSWATAVDFRETIPPASRFDAVFAPGTRQNRPHHPGSFPIYLARGLDASSLPKGPIGVEVLASDTRGNTARVLWILSPGV